MDLIDLIDSRRFLGSEFLMWLWFKSECFDGLFDGLVGGHDGGMEVVFDDAMTLEAYLAETERNTFKGGAPAYSPEAKTALRQGKRASKVKMRVIQDGREWVFTVKAESLDTTSINIPAVLSREEDEKFFERMYLVEEIENILAGIYREFLYLRLSDAWEEAILPAMRAWIATDEHSTPEMYPKVDTPPPFEIARSGQSPGARKAQLEQEQDESAVPA